MKESLTCLGFFFGWGWQSIAIQSQIKWLVTHQLPTSWELAEALQDLKTTILGVGRVQGVWWFPTVVIVRLSQPPPGDWLAGLGWAGMHDTVWFCMVMFAPIRSNLVLYGPFWSNIVLYGPLWSLMVLYGLIWTCMRNYINKNICHFFMFIKSPILISILHNISWSFLLMVKFEFLIDYAKRKLTDGFS